MTDDSRSLPIEELRSRSRDCTEMIKTVCARLSSDDEMEAGVRRLMRSKDLLNELAAIELEDREAALRILNAAVATLVNSHSVLSIEVEFKRRARERN